MRWFRDNSGWVALAATLVTGLVGLYARAALADTQARLAVLEAMRSRDEEAIKSIDAKVTQIHGWMMEDRRDRGRANP